MASAPISREARSWLLEALRSHGWSHEFQVEPLTAEASHRQFSRLRWSDPEHTKIFMRSPPALERNDAFIELAQAYAVAGLPVPTIYATQLSQGWLLLSDVGERDFFAAYESGQQATAVALAIDQLPLIAAVRSPCMPLYDAALVRFELEIFSEWFCAKLLQLDPPRTLLDPIWETLVANFAAQPQGAVHLDYHCRNLLLSTEGELGIVDFQDTRLGPISYDLASLLHDCYYELDEQAVAHWQTYFLANTQAAVDTNQFARQLNLTAMQRQLKAIGIFARLWLRDDKPTHLKYIVPLLPRLIRLAASEKASLPLAEWLETLIEPATKSIQQALQVTAPAPGTNSEQQA